MACSDEIGSLSNKSHIIDSNQLQNSERRVEKQLLACENAERSSRMTESKR